TGVPLVAQIFPETAAPAADLGEVVDRFDAHHVLRHLVTELPLDAQPQGSAVRDRKRLIVHLVGEDGLRMVRILKADRLVIFVFVVTRFEYIVGAIEHDVARIWLEPCAVEQRGKLHALPFADAAPSLNAIVPRDLRARGHGAQLDERQVYRLLDEASDG